MYQQILQGHIKNNTIFLDDQVQLPEGLQVKIILLPLQAVQPASGLCGIWQDVREAEEIVEEIYLARVGCISHSVMHHCLRA
jgi:hypothetical protein